MLDGSCSIQASTPFRIKTRYGGVNSEVVVGNADVGNLRRGPYRPPC